MSSRLLFIFLLAIQIMPAQTLNDPSCLSPEYFLEQITLPAHDANEVQIKQFTKTMSSLVQKLDKRLLEVQELQNLDIAKYKLQQNRDLSHQLLPDVQIIFSLVDDPELVKQTADLSSITFKLGNKYRTEADEITRSDISFANWVAHSQAGHGVQDSPGSRSVSVAIPQRSILFVSKFTEELIPNFTIFVKIFRQHLIKLRQSEQAAIKASSNIAIPILVRSVEFKDLMRLKLTLQNTITSYSLIIRS